MAAKSMTTPAPQCTTHLLIYGDALFLEVTSQPCFAQLKTQVQCLITGIYVLNYQFMF